MSFDRAPGSVKRTKQLSPPDANATTTIPLSLKSSKQLNPCAEPVERFDLGFSSGFFVMNAFELAWETLLFVANLYCKHRTDEQPIAREAIPFGRLFSKDL